VSGHGLDQDQIQQIISEVDAAKNGKINYSEFLAAALTVQDFLTEEKLWMIFKRFDVDNTDYISQDNIRDAMKKLGATVTAEEVKEALSEHDLTKDGRIGFDEFKMIFQHSEKGPGDVRASLTEVDFQGD
jgi:calcium-dependent protein kinase